MSLRKRHTPPARLAAAFAVATLMAAPGFAAEGTVPAAAAGAPEPGIEGDSPRLPNPTGPGDFAFKIEPGAAMAFTTPQVDKFNLGLGLNLKMLWALSRSISIGPTVGLLALPVPDAGDDPGTAWTAGVGLRLARPHDAQTNSSFAALSPWLDADGLFVRTGPLNRPGFQVGVGLSVPIGASRVVWLGPFVRYVHIMQFRREGFNNNDAKILTAGLSLELGSGVDRPAEVHTEVRRETEIRTVVKEVEVTRNVPVCTDRDADGLPDIADNCPDVVGPITNSGCPVYKKIVVKKDKLELKEKIYFDWDKSSIKKVSHPLLDDVVQALQDNHGFKVQIEGHTSSEGEAEHNQELSESRATAVRDYLVSHGVKAERLISKGFGPSQPIDTNATPAGREANRRVEFVVQQRDPTNEAN